MNPVLFIRFPEFIREHIVIHEMLGTLSAQFQHNAHGGIRIDIGIVTLGIHIYSISKENILIRGHEVFLCNTAFRMFLAVGDILLGDIVEIILHEFLFYNILNFLNADVFPVLNIPFNLTGNFVHIFFRHLLASIFIGA